MNKLIVILFVCLFWKGSFLFAGEVDSLLFELQKAETKEKKVELNLIISKALVFQEPENALTYAQNALKLSQELSNQKFLADAKLLNGLCYDVMESFPEAIQFYKESEKIYSNINDSVGLGNAYMNLGIVYYLSSDNATSLSYYYKGLTYKEALKDHKGVASIYNNIGNIYLIQEDYKKALEVNLKALKIAQLYDTDDGISSTYNNLGIAYKYLGDFDMALENYNKSLEIREKIGDDAGMSSCYTNIGRIYQAKGDFDKAIEYEMKSFYHAELTKNKRSLGASCVNLAESYFSKKEYSKAEKYYRDAIKLCRTAEAKEFLEIAYENMSELYQAMGNYPKALEYHQYFSNLKDSLLNESNLRFMADLEGKYKFESKNKEIEMLKQRGSIQELEIENHTYKSRIQNYLILSLAIGAILIAVFSFFIFKRYKMNRELNHKLSAKNEEINHKNEEIEKKNFQLEYKNKEITDSIRYAQRLQNAIFPDLEVVRKEFPQFFVYFAPKDIVSGDFYWLTKHQNTFYASVVDCTGHGVPGAFMSLVGFNGLNNALTKEGLKKPSQILDSLNKHVQQTVTHENDGGYETIKDGMDVALCSFEYSGNEVKVAFSGANNPLWIVRSVTSSEVEKPSFDSIRQLAEGKGDVFSPSDFSTSLEMTTHKSQSGTSRASVTDSSHISILNTQISLEEIKPNKQPIGFYEESTPFTNNELTLKKGDTIYLFSDGYADQFGGDKGKKFKFSRLKELLFIINSKSMEEQHKAIAEEFEKWKGDLAQVDDVCVLGIRV